MLPPYASEASYSILTSSRVTIYLCLPSSSDLLIGPSFTFGVFISKINCMAFLFINQRPTYEASLVEEQLHCYLSIIFKLPGFT